MSTRQQGKAVGTEQATITERGGQVGGGFDVARAAPYYDALMGEVGNLKNALISHASPDKCGPLLGVVKSGVAELERTFPGDHWQVDGVDIMARLDAIDKPLSASDYDQCLTLLGTFERDVRGIWSTAGRLGTTTGVGADAAIGSDSSPPTESRR